MLPHLLRRLDQEFSCSNNNNRVDGGGRYLDFKQVKHKRLAPQKATTQLSQEGNNTASW